jgi:hypothetical protein
MARVCDGFSAVEVKGGNHAALRSNAATRVQSIHRGRQVRLGKAGQAGALIVAAGTKAVRESLQVASGAVKAAKAQAGRPQVKAALGLFSIFSDFASSFAFFFGKILGTEYQNSGSPLVEPVTALALVLIVLNALLAAFITQYTLGVELVSKNKQQRILQRGQCGHGKTRAAPDKYQQRMAAKASVKHNAFLPAVQVRQPSKHRPLERPKWQPTAATRNREQSTSPNHASLHPPHP